jgi:predicted RNA-binding protein with PIN domain
MALIRILVDGYSLLHKWEALAPGRPRHSEAARKELIHYLRLYQDAIRTPITIVFDGSNAPVGTPKPDSTPELEILFSRKGQTADDIIERAAHRFSSYGEIMVVTDDYAERDTVMNFGGLTSSCDNFIQDVMKVMEDMDKTIKKNNLREKKQFNRPL